jgi:hypothetical protein
MAATIQNDYVVVRGEGGHLQSPVIQIRQATVNQDGGCTVTKLRVPQPDPVDRRDAAGLGLGQRRRGATKSAASIESRIKSGALAAGSYSKNLRISNRIFSICTWKLNLAARPPVGFNRHLRRWWSGEVRHPLNLNAPPSCRAVILRVLSGCIPSSGSGWLLPLCYPRPLGCLRLKCVL